MVTLQSVHGHTGLTHPFQFFDIWSLWRSGLSARVTESQKIKNGGLDQYGPEHFGRLIFATVRKNVGMKGLKCGTNLDYYRFNERTSGSQCLHAG